MSKHNEDFQHVPDSGKSPSRKGIIAVMLILIVISGWFVMHWLNKTENFPIRQIELVNKLNYQKNFELKDVAANAIDGGFFSMNVNVFRESLMSLPWIRDVTVRKIWPDKLMLNIIERRPSVRWHSIDVQAQRNVTENKTTAEDKVTQSLLSQEGVIFTPSLTTEQRIMLAELPLLSGPENRAKKVLQHCRQFIRILEAINTQVKYCEMDARHAWKIELSDGLRVNLGKRKVTERLQRFVSAFSQQLEQYLSYVSYADLRYSNGFSVRWTENSAPGSETMRLKNK